MKGGGYFTGILRKVGRMDKRLAPGRLRSPVGEAQLGYLI